MLSLIHCFNESFPSLRRIEFKGGDFSALVNQHENINLEFSNSDLLYLFIDFSSITHGSSTINTQSVSIKQGFSNDELHYQRPSK